MKIRVVIADDEELFRVGVAHVLSRDEEINVEYEASNGKELLSYLAETEHLPDIVITDIKMPGLNGFEATKAINQAYKNIGIIALTTYNRKPFIRNMIDAGAGAYLVKNSPPAQVLHTVKEVFYNGFYYDKMVMRVLNERSGAKNSYASKTVFDDDFLTPRESNVLELICRQYKTSEIGEQLFISPRTVEVHRKNLLTKTGVKNIAGLVIFAIYNNLVPSIIMD